MSFSGSVSSGLEEPEGLLVVGDALTDVGDKDVDRGGLGLPFLKVVSGGMRNFLRVRKRWHISKKISVMAGGDVDLRDWTASPRADLSYHVSDRVGDLVLSESKAVMRKDFRASIKQVGMTVRCEAGCSLSGKAIFPRIDIDDPRPINVFLAGALVCLAVGKPLIAYKVAPVSQTSIPVVSKDPCQFGVGVRVEAQMRRKALILSVHELSAVLGEQDK